MLPIHKTLKTSFDYDEIPPGYYYNAMREGPPVQRFWHRQKFESVAECVPDGAKLLDFGCSAGSFLAILGETRPSVNAVGVDIGSSQIEFAQSQVQPLFPDGRIRFETLPDTSCKIHYPNETFDVVTSIEVVEHLHPAIVVRFLLEARRVLKKTGKLILTTPNYRSMWPLIELALERLSPVKYDHQHINKFTPNSLIKVIEGAGFEIQSVETLFVVAPFLAGGSKRLAEVVHGLEKASKLRMGSILQVVATPMTDEELAG